MKVEIVKNDTVEDEYILPFGLRTVEVKNGNPIFLRGFSRHEEYPIIGAGLFLPGIVRDYSLMKNLGANSLRTSHYPNTEEMMMMADRLGFLVIDECPANALFYARSKNNNMNKVVTPATLKNHKKSLMEMIQRDKNHPSVIIWSVANEPNTDMPESEKYFREMYRYVRMLDASRLVVIGGAGGKNDHAVKYFDLVCTNIYIMAYNLSGDFGLEGKKVGEYLDMLHRKYKKPIMVTEFGAPAIPGMHSEPPESWTEEFQARHLETYLDVIESKDYVVGAHIWCLAEFKAQQHFGRVINNRKGIFTRTRDPKIAVSMLKKRWMNSKNNELQ